MKEEAETFEIGRITKAMGSPVLVPYFDMAVTIKDASDTIEQVSVCGKSAVRFYVCMQNLNARSNMSIITTTPYAVELGG